MNPYAEHAAACFCEAIRLNQEWYRQFAVLEKCAARLTPRQFYQASARLAYIQRQFALMLGHWRLCESLAVC